MWMKCFVVIPISISWRWNLFLAHPVKPFHADHYCCFYLTVRTMLRQKKTGWEIKNDFINNMTHEFKTPIATIYWQWMPCGMKSVQDRDKLGYFSSIIKEENQRDERQVETIQKLHNWKSRSGPEPETSACAWSDQKMWLTTLPSSWKARKHGGNADGYTGIWPDTRDQVHFSTWWTLVDNAVKKFLWGKCRLSMIRLSTKIKR